MDQQPVTPAPQPTAPAPAPTPSPASAPMQPMGPPTAGMPPTGKKPNMKLILGIVGGAVVALVLLIVLAIVLASGGVSKTDYKEAADGVSELRTSYSKVTGVYLSSSSTDVEVKNGVERMQEGQKEFDEDFNALKGLKAIKNDAEVAAVFKKIDEKKPKFDTAVEAQVESYEKILPISQKVSDSSSSTNSVASAVASLEAMKNELKALDLKHQVNKDYVSNIVGWLEEYIPIIEKYAEGRADYKKYDSAVTSKYYDLSGKGSEIDRDWRSNMEKLTDEGQIRDQVNDLITELNKKQFEV